MKHNVIESSGLTQTPNRPIYKTTTQEVDMRVKAKASFSYDDYEIEGRIYQRPNQTSWFRIVVLVKVNGKVRATFRDEACGLYVARKMLTTALAECHGRY